MAVKPHQTTSGRSQRFRRSSNIERDRHDADSIRDFILTGCARTTLRRLVEGLGSSAQKAWTLTGPYGTGKSSFCVFLAALFDSTHSGACELAHASLRRVEPALSATIRGETKARRGIIPILVTGRREALHVTIARGFADALRSVNGKPPKALAAELDSLRPTRPSVEFLRLMERSIKCLVARTDGARSCLLILDEMGKSLEFAAANPEQSDVYLLQQLGELASQSESSLAVIGVLHQDFSGYSRGLLPGQQQEWEKVRGRFEDIVFEQSADDMLRLIGEAISRSGDLKTDQSPTERGTYLNLCRAVLKLSAISRDPESTLSLLERCAPLHPAVAILLGPVFKRFGQNERSAFSFLRSAEPFGLPDFEIRAGGQQLYRLVDLYQYLNCVFGDALLASRDGRRWAEAFSIESQHLGISANESEVLRTIAMLNIVGKWHGLPATREAIITSTAPKLTKGDVEEAIRILERRSAIVFRKFNKSFNLWEGSDVDVESKITEAKLAQASDIPTTHLLRGIFAPRPLVARRHSYERGTLRYFDIVPVDPTRTSEAVEIISGSTADGHLLVVLHDLSEPKLFSGESTKPLTARPNTLLCVPGNAKEVECLARELAAIDSVERSVRDLQNDPTAMRELAGRKDEVRRKLDDAVASLLSPGGAGAARTRWIRGTEEVRIRSQRELNEYLSTVCDELFADCPTIQNEIINRRELSSSAAAAQRNLLVAMVEHSAADGLAIDGNPPEKSIYLSVLKRLGIHQREGDRYRFVTGPSGIEATAKPMMKAVRRFLDDSTKEARSLDQLFYILRSGPYGLRDGIIPIIACAALLAHEAEIAIYENGAFLPQITEPIIEKFVKSPGSYSVRRWHVDGVRAAIFEQLAEMLGQSAVAGNIEKRDLLDVVKPLLKFVRRLNDFTRTTKTFSPTAIAVRDSLLDASEPDQLLFVELPKACGVHAFGAKKAGSTEEVQTFRRSLQNALSELQKGYDTLLHSLLEELSVALDNPPHPSGIRASLRQRAVKVTGLALNADLKVFSSRLADASVDDRAWIESIASFLSNKHPSQWNDDDRPRLGVRLAQISSAFRSLESLALSRQRRVQSEREESLHLAVVGSAFSESSQVVHIAAEDDPVVSKIESKLRSVLTSYDSRTQRRLVIAALARIVHSTLNDEPAVLEAKEVHT